MDAILRELTEPQRQAVTHIQGPLLILAGPGSGKTRVITHRIAHMINEGIAPWNILALTFTNKAADEMRNRVSRLAPGQPVWMGTFHRFCAQLLRRNASLVGLRENYSILDTNDTKQVMRRAIEVANVSTSHASPDKIANLISRYKNQLVTPEQLEGQALSAADTVAARVYPVYQQLLLTSNAVDFDDLLLHVALLLRDNTDLRAELDEKHRYIMIDEYQDTNLAQYAIARALSVRNPNLAVTGDPDQSIYGWRGADINNILNFEKDYPNVRVVRLEENYRSTPEILHVADTLIRNNRRRKAKELFTHNPSGEPVVLRSYNDGHEEADDIVHQVAAGMENGRLRPRDVAIFCRMNALTRSFEHAFRSMGIPYQIVNGVEFYQRKEVKDILAYLHLVNNPSHDVALLRVINTPTRGIGTKTVKLLTDYANHHRIPLLEAAREVRHVSGLAARSAKAVTQFVELYDRIMQQATAPLTVLLKHLIKETSYMDYLDAMADDSADVDRAANIDELIVAASEFDEQHPEDHSLEAFLEQVALVSDTDAWEGSDDRVTLMTLHAAKGLEFPHVYIIAVENGLLPHERSMDDPNQIEEERRLLFVGITRAEKTLQLSYARRRNIRGTYRPCAPSHFLVELPRADMRLAQTPDPADFFQGSHQDELDQSTDYPDSWDEDFADNSSADDFDSGTYVSEHTPVGRKPTSSSPARSATEDGYKLSLDQFTIATGAELLSRQSDEPQLKFAVGMMVEHPRYGFGRVITLTGSGLKETARVAFESGNEESFRVLFSPLKPAE